MHACTHIHTALTTDNHILHVQSIGGQWCTDILDPIMIIITDSYWYLTQRNKSVSELIQPKCSLIEQSSSPQRLYEVIATMNLVYSTTQMINRELFLP